MSRSCARAFVAGMRAAGYGKIINISSATVFIGRPLYLHYVTSKAAVIGMTRSVATGSLRRNSGI